jgi:hypothetical protein
VIAAAIGAVLSDVLPAVDEPIPAEAPAAQHDPKAPPPAPESASPRAATAKPTPVEGENWLLKLLAGAQAVR